MKSHILACVCAGYLQIWFNPKVPQRVHKSIIVYQGTKILDDTMIVFQNHSISMYIYHSINPVLDGSMG